MTVRKGCTGIVLLGLVLLPGFAAGADGMASASVAISSTLQSAPAEPADAPLQARPLQNPVASVKRAVFGREAPSRDVRHIADWVVDSGDNRGLPFVVIDKIEARVFVFDAGGRTAGDRPRCWAWGRGDDTVPGIGDRWLRLPYFPRSAPRPRAASWRSGA